MLIKVEYTNSVQKKIIDEYFLNQDCSCRGNIGNNQEEGFVELYVKNEELEFLKNKELKFKVIQNERVFYKIIRQVSKSDRYKGGKVLPSGIGTKNIKY